MPKSATSKDGPQAVESYIYPDGEADGSGWEWVSRRGWVTDDTPTPNATHTWEVTDGKGGLPITDQPKEIPFRMSGIITYHTHVTLMFRRRDGDTGPYSACQIRLDPPSGPVQPHTIAQ